MSLTMLGRRFERLLFFAAPLSLSAILILFVVFASETQEEKATAKCYEIAAAAIEKGLDVLNESWGYYAANGKRSFDQPLYHSHIRKAFILSINSACWDKASEGAIQHAEFGPMQMMQSLRAEAARLRSVPVRYPGIELPDKATVPFVGTTISINFPLFAGVLQGVLAPLLLLWLGSLYNTRYRESLLIERARMISDLFPHLINVYPVGGSYAARRRARWRPVVAILGKLWYALVRICLLLIFIGPPVTSYVVSVVLLSSSAFAWLLPFAILVSLFSIALVIVELLPWHSLRTFPGSLLEQQYRGAS